MNLLDDPTKLIRIAAIYLFTLSGTALIAISCYDVIAHGTITPQIYSLLQNFIGAALVMVGYHSNTFAAALVNQIAKNDETSKMESH